MWKVIICLSDEEGTLQANMAWQSWTGVVIHKGRSFEVEKKVFAFERRR